MRSMLLICGAATIVTSAPASACIASGPDGFTHGLVWENPPSDVPIDAMLLKVERTGHVANSWGFTARIDEGPEKMVGRTFRIISEASHSCVGWGANSGYLVVRMKLVEWMAGEPEVSTKFFAAVEYEPSWFNELLRFFGASPWKYPGEKGPGRRSFDD